MAEEWRLAALCAEVDGELFFPKKGGAVKPALRICNRCEAWVREACLADALEVEGRLAGVPIGVRGGKTAKQREVLLGKRRQAAGEPA